ncbi:hypothetical protein PHYSODRAFT_500573, partial [Phytophthora sojae]
MPRTTPTSADQEPVSVTSSRVPRISRVTRCCYGLDKLWSEVQVGRQGSNSIERAESMDYYCKNSSLTRVIAVCVLTPLPTLACAILLQYLPLQPPSERWAANWVFWIRLGLMVFLLTFAGVSELKIFIPELHFTWCKRVIIAFGTTAAYMGTCLLVASFVGFPVPFVWQFGGSLLGVYIPLMVLLVFGRKQLDRSSRCYPSLCRFLRFFFAYIVLIELYPLYKVLCDLAPLDISRVVVVVLPVWRLAAENFIVQSTRQLEDLIPAMVTFSVDLFSMLFVSVCISTSGSIRMSLVVIVID